MYYYSRNISLSDLATEVSGITGKQCVVITGNKYSCYPDPKDESRFIITVPKGTFRISPVVRHGVVHEAMHLLYTDAISASSVHALMAKCGIKTQSERGLLFSFVNAFEDIRIQLKGEKEFWGARHIFQEGRDAICYDIYNQIQAIHNDSSKGDQTLNASRAFLISNIDLVPGYMKYPGEETPSYWSSPCPQSAVWTMHSLLGHWWQHEFYIKDYHKEFPSLNLDRVSGCMQHLAKRFVDTATTGEGFQLAAKYFLEHYLDLIPPDQRPNLTDANLDKFSNEFKAGCDRGEFKQLTDEDKAELQKGCEFGTGMIRAMAGSEEEMDALMQKLSEGGMSLHDQREREDTQGRIEVINTIASEVKQGLADILQTIKEYRDTGGERLNLKRGKLDPLQIHRIALDEMNVYKKNIEKDFNDDVAFSIVIDTSGSMWGDATSRDPFNSAFGLGVGLNHALEMIERTSSVVDFSNEATERVKAGLKATNQNIEQAILEGGGGTQVYLGAEKAVASLTRCDEKSKIMFILSDGDIYPDDLPRIHDMCKEKGITPFFIIIKNGRDFEEFFIANWPNKDKLPLREYIKPGDTKKIISSVTKFVRHLMLGKE